MRDGRGARRLPPGRGRRRLPHGRGSGTIQLSPEGLRGVRVLLRTPLADAQAAGLSDRGAREALAVVTTSYEHHGGFRLRTLSA